MKREVTTAILLVSIRCNKPCWIYFFYEIQK